MATITQRISEFRGINRSVQQNGLDISYAYDAVNVDIRGGKLSSKIGSYRFAIGMDVPAARPIIYFTNDMDYVILRDKFIALDSDSIDTVGPYDKVRRRFVALKDVYNVSGRYIRGIGKNFVRVQTDFVEEENEGAEDKNCVIVSGMLGGTITPGTPAQNEYWTKRGLLTDGLSGKTAMYYLGHENGDVSAPLAIVCRKFGSGIFLEKDLEITDVEENASGKASAVTVKCAYELSNATQRRILTDGIWLFTEMLGATLTDENVNNAYMWLNVKEISTATNTEDLTDPYYYITFTVETTRNAEDITVGTYVYVRGGCSDYAVTFMQMHYGRLFAASSPENKDFPRRLFWSRLPGDGRSIEDWTSDDASTDTGGGHVDIGDPSDGYITGLVECSGQLLIFTLNKLWRLYGTSPSNYRVELIGVLNSPRISNPIETNGTVYWLSLTGISYYNGSYISSTDDDYNTRHMLEDLSRTYLDSMDHDTVHGVLFDNSIMFAFDVFPAEDNAVLLRYELQTGNVVRYYVPFNGFLQQFTDSMIKNFGADSAAVNYEARYFQAMVNSNHAMIMTQWHSWGRQDYGFYDNMPVYAKWSTDWNDLRTPEIAKKIHTAIFRGSGEFDFAVESENSKAKNHVVMPNSRAKVKEISPPYAEGRSFRLEITSDKQFEIEPYATLIFESGGVR